MFKDTQLYFSVLAEISFVSAEEIYKLAELG